MVTTFHKYDALIDRVDKPPPGHPDEGKPDMVLYSGFVCNTPDAARFGPIKPKRRVSKSARIIPAEVGDPCELKIVNGKTFLYVDEGIAFQECEEL
jgi:hypothetical protein